MYALASAVSLPCPLWLTHSTGSGGGVHMYVQMQGGATFGPAYQQADLPEPTGGCQASSLVVGGKVLFAAPAAGDEARYNLTIRRSDDGGKSYPQKKLLMAGPGGYSVLTHVPQHAAAALGASHHSGGGGGGSSDRLVGLAFESGADGCTGGSCRIRFVTLPVAF